MTLRAQPEKGTSPLHLGGRITCASEIVCVFIGWDGCDGLSDCVGDGVEGSGRGFSDEAFELGEDLLDRVEVG